MTVTSHRAAIRNCESPTEIMVLRSERKWASRAAAGAATSLVVHHTLAGLPGSRVASMLVRPPDSRRLVISPGSTFTLAWLPGMSRASKVVPADGVGIRNDARPASTVIAEAPLRETEKR